MFEPCWSSPLSASARSMLRLASPLPRSTRPKQPDFITNILITASGLPRPIACHQLVSGSTTAMVPSFLVQIGIRASPLSWTWRPDERSLPPASAGVAASAAAKIADRMMVLRNVCLPTDEVELAATHRTGAGGADPPKDPGRKLSFRAGVGNPSLPRPVKERRFSNMGLARALLLALLPLATAAAPPSPAGEYRLVGEVDVASGFLLTQDGHFQYFLMAGSLDQRAEGRWTSDGKTVLFTSEPKPVAPLFKAGTEARTEA